MAGGRGGGLEAEPSRELQGSREVSSEEESGRHEGARCKFGSFSASVVVSNGRLWLE